MTAVGALISAQHCIEYLLPFVQSLRTLSLSVLTAIFQVNLG